jgi:transcriptional regulator with XRE-family HTH domain
MIEQVNRLEIFFIRQLRFIQIKRYGSQQQLADRLRLTQRAYANWERNPVALRPDQLLSLAQTLNVSVDDLVGTNGTKKRGTGPTGKMKQLFEAASRLPRCQQQKIAATIEPFIAHHAQR